MIDFHKEQGRYYIATIPVNAKDATGFGIMKADEEGNITAFTEKPSLDALKDWKSETSDESKAKGKEYLASMGIYVFTKNVLRQLFADYEGDDFGKDFIPASIGTLNVLSYQYDGYWTDIGTIESFYEANLDLAQIYLNSIYSVPIQFTQERECFRRQRLMVLMSAKPFLVTDVSF
jgi:glucose-1-phosphate adenylyltransferase